MTRFREGDVVGYFPEEEGRQMGVEMVVLGHGEDGRPECRDLNDPSRLSGYPRPSRLRLLRRPVRVGDMLRNKQFHGCLVTADDGHVRYPDFERFEHADGTPIEPPKAEEKPAPVVVERIEPAPLTIDEGDEANSEGAMLDRYARALFETDQRVIDLVGLVADCESPAGFAVQDWGDEGLRISERWEAAMARAWERGKIIGTSECTWRLEAECRAVRFYDRLLGRP